MESSKKSSSEYRSIFKATGILGGVQLFNILIGVVRNKIVSILLGPAGMGIVGLLTSSTSTITGFTNCGLTISAMKNIAVAYKNEDMDELGRVLYVVKRLLWCTGILATFLCVLLCKQLSIWAFGNEDFKYSFCFLSVSLLFTQLTAGNQMIIKGCRQIRMYAKANIIGNFLSLFITVPLYFIWGINAIVPVLILLSLSTFLVSYYYQRKLLIKEEKVDTQEFKKVSSDILKAGFAILNGYVGMIFTAMSSDFIPRLSAVINDNKACEDTVNNQIRVSVMILLPILTLFVIFSKLIVGILYTSEFYPITEMIMWGAIGMFLKSTDWSMGCLFVPKRETKVYLALSIWAFVKYLLVNILCYKVWGLAGFGVALVFNHSLAILVNAIYFNYKYKINYSKDVLLYTILGCLYFGLLIATNNYLDLQKTFIALLDIFFVSVVSVFSIKKLDQYMDIINLVKNRFLKK